jgi:hypothetical protein
MTPRHCLATLLLSLSLSPYATGFFVQPMTQKMNVQRQQRALLATSRSAARSPESDDVTSRVTKMVTPSSKSGGTLRSTLAAAALCTVLATTALPTAPAAAAAYDDSLDAASQTIEQVLTSLNEAAGDSDRTFAVYERINGIITEGAGVGGNINYKGIQLGTCGGSIVANHDTYSSIDRGSRLVFAIASTFLLLSSVTVLVFIANRPRLH